MAERMNWEEFSNGIMTLIRVHTDVNSRPPPHFYPRYDLIYTFKTENVNYKVEAKGESVENGSSRLTDVDFYRDDEHVFSVNNRDHEGQDLPLFFELFFEKMINSNLQNLIINDLTGDESDDDINNRASTPPLSFFSCTPEGYTFTNAV